MCAPVCKRHVPRLCTVLLALLLCLLQRAAAAPGDVLFRHEFRGSTHGWTAASDYNAAAVSKFSLGAMGHGIEGSDTSAAPWFFQAPPEILGDRSAAYDGLLRVTYGHRCLGLPHCVATAPQSAAEM